MLAFIACFCGVLAILVFAELLWRADILRGEYQRKFVHVLAGTFFATWPWLLSWRQIEVMGVLMLGVLGANNIADHVLHYSAGLRRKSFGGVCLALAVIVCALITKDRTFFAIAILQTSLADGFAAVFGTRFGKNWEYKAFGQAKTVIGTMAFWLTSLIILGVGLSLAGANIPQKDYVWILLGLPPALAAVENITPFGLDNLTVPLATLLVLELL